MFARALHAMAKIGEDLYLSPQRDGLALRTMNTSRSAFASFLFEPVFFTLFDLESGGRSGNADAEEAGDEAGERRKKRPSDSNCKITMKVCGHWVDSLKMCLLTSALGGNVPKKCSFRTLQSKKF